MLCYIDDHYKLKTMRMRKIRSTKRHINQSDKTEKLPLNSFICDPDIESSKVHAQMYSKGNTHKNVYNL